LEKNYFEQRQFEQNLAESAPAASALAAARLRWPLGFRASRAPPEVPSPLTNTTRSFPTLRACRGCLERRAAVVLAAARRARRRTAVVLALPALPSLVLTTARHL
jgi:hypothetical protein